MKDNEVTIKQQLKLIVQKLDKQEKTNESLLSRLDSLKNARGRGGRSEMASNLRIMPWNANGLLQHKENLTVTRVDQKIDVCLKTETHFTRESYIRQRGFDVYRAMHLNNCVRGGSVVIIKKEISHHEDVMIEKAELQVTSVKINILATDFFSIFITLCI